MLTKTHSKQQQRLNDVALIHFIELRIKKTKNVMLPLLTKNKYKNKIVLK